MDLLILIVLNILVAPRQNEATVLTPEREKLAHQNVIVYRNGRATESPSMFLIVEVYSFFLFSELACHERKTSIHE